MKLGKISNPTVSLVIPAYNEEEYIRDCLKSAINQKEKFLEIIVVENNCTDNTAEIVKEFKEVTLVYESEKGVTRARQRGAKESKGDIIAFIDADNRIPEDWCKKVKEEFSSDEELACVSGPYFFYDASKLEKIPVHFYWNFLAIPSYRFTGYMALGGNFAIRKDVYMKIGGFDTSIEFYGDDTDISRRASKYGKSKFTKNLTVYSSARRFNGQGLIKTGYMYVANFISVSLMKKPVHKNYEDYR